MDELRELAYLIYDWLLSVSGKSGFVAGFWLGVAALAVASFLAFVVRVWWGEVTAPYRPQTVVHRTSRTPAEISRRGCMVFVVGILVVASLACILMEMVSPGMLEGVLQTLGL